MAVFSSISDTGYDTVITTLGQQDLSNAVWLIEISYYEILHVFDNKF